MNLDPAMLEVTAVQVVDGLWIGSASADLPAGVSLVVTLDEVAAGVDGPGVSEVREPFPDSRWQPVDPEPVSAALRAAEGRLDGSVLIRCRHGLNRSALIAALVLRGRGWTSDDAITAVRQVRPGALSNPYFADLVATWPEDPMATRP